ncbi:MAG: EamA family transporter [Candidatus Hydrogenedentota bacterium]|nr:MAG: EamA family transporter [Candidatus Hydrogenedentota bacterium]
MNVRNSIGSPSRSRRGAHLTALGQMFAVTVLWSSSFPIHKALMNEGMPPLSLAAYRYFSASVILMIAFGLRSSRRVHTVSSPQGSGPGQWAILLGIGLFMYTAQGVHITALSLISASDSGLVSMTFMPVAVAILTSLLERSPPTRMQLGGLGIILAGIYIYFPHNMGGSRLAGVLLNVLSSSMWAVAVVLTHIAVSKMRMTSLKLTTVSMMTGSSVLLLIALMHDRLYVPAPSQLLWLAYLAFVNTALGFALYNHTMKSLGAFEIATFQDSMVIQIGILSAIFLGDTISAAMALGMVMVVFGVAVVQYFAPER